MLDLYHGSNWSKRLIPQRLQWKARLQQAGRLIPAARSILRWRLRATQAATFLEEAIRADPGQWLLIHRRWKTRPPGEPPLYG